LYNINFKFPELDLVLFLTLKKAFLVV
jgi:hypothetical protein